MVKAKKAATEGKKVATNWVNFLGQYRQKHGGKFGSDKEGNIALMREAGVVWKAMSKEAKDAYKIQAAIAETKSAKTT